MCPLCAALYSHARRTADDLLLKQLRERAEVAEAGRVTLSVALDVHIVDLYFTERHAADLIIVPKAAGNSREITAGAS